jgi:thiamine transport system ATP-binding protein
MLAVRGLSKRFGPTTALSDVDFEVGTGETVSVLGPSGSGKSTLLRVIAGLEPPDEGSVLWDHSDITTVPAHARQFGLMFQDYALFPHRDVAGNVGFGLRMAGGSPSDIDRRVGEVLELVGLAGMQGRRIDQLSGGEAQRVALARALAPQPRMLLLDEPLSALDLELRPRTRVFLQEILASFPGPRLVITHEPREALLLADRVVVLERGRVVQQGSPDELRKRPQTPYVARLAGVNLLEGTLDGRRLRAGELSLDVEPGQLGLAAGTPLLATVHPHSVRVERADAEPGHEGAWETLVEGVELEGDRVRIELRQPAGFVAELPAADLDLRRFSPGTAIRASIPRDQISIYPRMSS